MDNPTLQGAHLFTSLQMLYEEIERKGPHTADAEALVGIRNQFGCLTHVDPRSGEALPRSLRDIAAGDGSGGARDPKDRLARIIGHVTEALPHVLDQLRTQIRRGHEIMPVHAAKEFDSVSVTWLSRKSGRTVREKLGGRHSLMAVRRRMSVDTAENRLVREFALRLDDLLRLRDAAFPASAAESAPLREAIRRWLRSDAAAEIGRWNNVPPNNILLQDQHYRKIWDAWLWLQDLDAATVRDQSNRLSDWVAVLVWRIIDRLRAVAGLHLLEQPCRFDSDRLTILPALGCILGLHVPEADDGKLTGKVSKLGTDKNGGLYGFATCAGHPSVFFHANELLDPAGADRIQCGDRLRFRVEVRAKGPMARQVERVDPAADRKGTPFSLTREGEDIVVVTLGERSMRIQAALPAAPARYVELSVDGAPMTAQASAEGADAMAGQVVKRLFPNAPPRPGRSAEATASPVRHAVVDLTSVRPFFATDRGRGVLPFFLLRQFWPVDGYGMFPVDVGLAQAIPLGRQPETLSILSLIGKPEHISPAARLNAARGFSEKLREAFPCDRLVYIVPDTADDFSLETMRSALNASFKQAQSLPRSIALLFRWLSSKRRPEVLDEGDCVLVIDTAGDTASLTALIPRTDPSGSLQASVPPTRGLFWEKYPSVHLGSEGAALAMARAALRKTGCPAPDQVASLLGLTGIRRYGAHLALWSAESGWSTPRLGEAEPTAANGTALREAMEQALADVRKRWPSPRNVHVLLAGELAETARGVLPRVLADAATVWTPDDVAAGGAVLLEWQEKSGGVPLWKEHLPELSMWIPRNGRFSRVHLVSQSTIIPRRGATMQIPIDETFTLPAGIASYSFPLRQGSEGRALNHRIVLQSPAFPLERDLKVALRMTFTYGADNPYDLSFVPLAGEPAPANFSSVHAQWRPLEELKVSAGAVPRFPQRLTWSELRNAERRDGSTTDHLERLQRQWQRFRECPSIVRTGSDEHLRQHLERMRRTLRLPAQTIWSQGRSLRDVDCPEEFRTFVFREIPLLWNTYWDLMEAKPRDSIVSKLADEFFRMLCCLHGDLPEDISGHVREQLESALKNPGGHPGQVHPFAYAIGRGDFDWQRDMLSTLAQASGKGSLPSRQYALRVLAVALWRAEDLLDQFSLTQLSWVLDGLRREMVRLARTSIGEKEVDNSSYYYELLLALLRLRQSADEEKAELLAIGSECTELFSRLTERLTEGICETDHPVKSRRVSWQFTKPAAFANTDDLLYALHSFLNGEPDADTIMITGVSEGDG